MSELNGRHLSFPFRIGPNGRTAQVNSYEDHVRGELMQLILTDPGERPFLTEFGAGIRRLVFENMDATTAGMTKASITQAITRWMGHRIDLEDVQVTVEHSTMEISIQYRLAGTEDSRVMKFQRSA
jgi:phage baseplate assembly protein W